MTDLSVILYLNDEKPNSRLRFIEKTLQPVGFSDIVILPKISAVKGLNICNACVQMKWHGLLSGHGTSKRRFKNVFQTLGFS